jgi:hypothetical protein
VRITSSWTCEEAEVRDSRQQAQGFDSERCTSCRLWLGEAQEPCEHVQLSLPMYGFMNELAEVP